MSSATERWCMATVTDLNTKADLAVAAIGDGDYSTALTYLLQCKVILATQPEIRKGDNELRYDAAAIDSLVRQVRELSSGTSTTTAGGISSTKITWANTTD